MPERFADLLIFGKIYTADAEGSLQEAMAVKDGKIIAVGTRAGMAALCGPETELLLPDGLVMPGIVEGHAHVTCASEMVLGVALGHAEEPGTYLERITAWRAEHPSAARVFGSGYDNGVFGAEGPTAALLDTVCPDVPAVMVASDHHSRWLNSKAVALCGITEETPDPVNGHIVRDAAGHPTGWLQETAMQLANPALPEITAEVYAEAVKYYQQTALANGVTAVFEPMFDPLRDYALRAEGYRLLEQQGGLYLTARLGWSLEEDDDFDRNLADMKRLRERLAPCNKVKLTTAKFFVDGVVECHTAWLREPYADSAESGDCGAPCIGRERLRHDSLAALREGFDLHMHVIGDAAAAMAADAIVNAQDTVKAGAPAADFRNALTHLQLVGQDTAEQIAANGIRCVVNPYWHYFSPVYYDTLEKPYLGPERAFREYPMRTLVCAGARLSQASDYPVTVPPDTMDCLHLMVNRTEPGVEGAQPLNAAECLTVREALDILTIGGAEQLRLENTKGSLEPGKDADFVFLSGDPFTMPPEALSTLEVQATYIEGVRRFSAAR